MHDNIEHIVRMTTTKKIGAINWLGLDLWHRRGSCWNTPCTRKYTVDTKEVSSAVNFKEAVLAATYILSKHPTDGQETKLAENIYYYYHYYGSRSGFRKGPPHVLMKQEGKATGFI